jgi:hypothetical protein
MSKIQEAVESITKDIAFVRLMGSAILASQKRYWIELSKTYTKEEKRSIVEGVLQRAGADILWRSKSIVEVDLLSMRSLGIVPSVSS